MIRSVALVATIALLAGAALGRQAPAVRTRVLYPANRSFHTRAVTVIVVTPASTATLRATLNGKPLALRRMRFAEGWVLPGSLEATAKAVGDRRKAVLWVGNVADRPGRGVCRQLPDRQGLASLGLVPGLCPSARTRGRRFLALPGMSRHAG